MNSVENISAVNIYSLKGELILTQNVQSERIVKINTTTFANGSYTLQVSDNKGNIIKSEKLIINHP